MKLTLVNDQYQVQQTDPPMQKDAWLGILMEFPADNNFGVLDPVVQALELVK